MNFNKIMDPPIWWSVTYRALYVGVFALASAACAGMVFLGADPDNSVLWAIMALSFALFTYLVGNEAHSILRDTDEGRHD